MGEHEISPQIAEKMEQDARRLATPQRVERIWQRIRQQIDCHIPKITDSTCPEEKRKPPRTK